MYAVFDIGGTKTRVAITENLETFCGEPQSFDTPTFYHDGVRTITDRILEMANGIPITHVAGGLRGRLLEDKSGMYKDDVLLNWQGHRVIDDMSELLRAPVRIENDAAMAALGEAHFGAGKGYDIVAYHTVSTGMGGARIDHGMIDAHAAGFEPGKQTLDVDHTLCDACESTMLEDHVSGTAMQRRFGKKAYEIPQNDPVWNELALWLAYGLKNTILYWSPHVIVLGGSMILGDPRIRLEDIQRHVQEVLGADVLCPVIKDANFRDFGGLYGGIAFIGQWCRGEV